MEQYFSCIVKPALNKSGETNAVFIAKAFELFSQIFILRQLECVTMKHIIILIRVIAAIVLITIGVDNISEPSNFNVAIGVLEVVLGIAVIYQPITSLFRKL